MTSAFELDGRSRTLLERARAVGAELAGSVSHGTGVDRGLLAALSGSGLLGRLFPEGGRVSALDLCLMRQGLAYRCTEAETALALQGLGAYPILQAGREEVVSRWIPEVASGRAVAAFALTEPGAGSDAATIATRAERCEGGWRISGVKKWISNAPHADVYTLFARTGGPGARGVSAFVVEGGARGLSGRSLELLSPHPVGELRLDGVVVPDECLLGEEGAGFRVAMATLDLFRPSVGAFAVGMGEAALDAALHHTASRPAFSGVLADLQAVRHRLADVAARLHAARLLVYEAACTFDSGRVSPELSAMAKLVATEVAQEVIDAAVQVHGAAALERGHLLEKLYREVRATRIYEGASEVQRDIIARALYRRVDGGGTAGRG